MQTKLIQIGNSMGLRLPKSLIKHFNLDKSAIEIIVESDGIKIKPSLGVPPLESWDLMFKKALAIEPADKDIFDGLPNVSDSEEWTW
jgi:antitoxin MazE